MIFSKMLQKARKHNIELGELTGTCCICGKNTEQGHIKKFSANFTSAEFVSNGDVICEYCKHLVDNSNEYRRTMFLLTEKEYKPFKKDEAKDIILNLPNEPFYLYLTKTWQKIGWVNIFKAYNTSNKEFKVLIDYDLVYANIAYLNIYFKLIEELRELKIPKTVLESGNLEPHHYRKIVELKGKVNARMIQNELKINVNVPLWDLAVYLND